MCISGKYPFNFQAGLRILHIDQANYDLNEVAYFDVNDQEKVDFSGSFCNYPYFPSGTDIWQYNSKLNFVICFHFSIQ